MISRKGQVRVDPTNDRLNLWVRLEKWPWRVSIQQGLAPVSIGLLLAGCLTMAKGAVTGWTTGGIALAVLLILQWRKINPALLVLAGALIGGVVFRT